jgi:hypothetical protein
MTATDLYEIVRDVPREAWGELDWYCGEFVRKHTYDVVESEIAESAFVGSMTAWLVSHDEMDLRPDWRNGVLAYLSVKCRTGEWVGGTSIVAALAAACKEVGT